MYRYRDTTGTTERALAALKHLPKLGVITEIRGYQYRSRRKLSDGTWITRVDHRIKVFGDKGVALFNGFCYGYGGTGPHGLIELFKAVGVPTGPDSVGDKCAFHIKMADSEVKLGHPVVDWTLALCMDDVPKAWFIK